MTSDPVCSTMLAGIGDVAIDQPKGQQQHCCSLGRRAPFIAAPAPLGDRD